MDPKEHYLPCYANEKKELKTCKKPIPPPRVNFELSTTTSNPSSCSSSSELSIIENSVKMAKQVALPISKKHRRRKTSLEIEADIIAYRNIQVFNETANLFNTLDTLKPSSCTSLNLHSELRWEAGRNILSDQNDTDKGENELSGDQKNENFDLKKNFLEDHQQKRNPPLKGRIVAVQEFYDSGSESESSHNEEKNLIKKKNENKEKEFQFEKELMMDQDKEFSHEWFQKITKREIEKVFICSMENVVIPETRKETHSFSSLIAIKQKKVDKFLIQTTDENFELLCGEEKKFCDNYLKNFTKIVSLGIGF